MPRPTDTRTSLFHEEAQARLMAMEAQAALVRSLLASLGRWTRRSRRSVLRLLTGERGLLSR